MSCDIVSMLLECVWTMLAWTWYIIKCTVGFCMVILLCLPTVAEASEQQSFPDIAFKIFDDFVSHHFSSRLSLATVLLVLFSLTLIFLICVAARRCLCFKQKIRKHF